MTATISGQLVETVSSRARPDAKSRLAEYRKHRAAVLLFLVLFLRPGALRADEFVVTKTADTADGACDADCSLREAVLAANSGPGHVITIPAGTYRLTRVPAPTDPEDGNAGSLYVNRPVTINGAGKDVTIIDARPSNGAEGIDRVLLVGFLGTPTITGVTLRGGRVATGSPRNLTGGIGGGVFAQRAGGSGAVTFVDSAITDNVASQSGGGLLVQKTVFDTGADDLVLLRTDVLRNRATDENLGQGGGIWNGNANVHIIDSTIDGNIASNSGGAIHLSKGQTQLDASLTISGSTISNNIAGLTGSRRSLSHRWQRRRHLQHRRIYGHREFHDHRERGATRHTPVSVGPRRRGVQLTGVGQSQNRAAHKLYRRLQRRRGRLATVRVGRRRQQRAVGGEHAHRRRTRRRSELSRRRSRWHCRGELGRQHQLRRQFV